MISFSVKIQILVYHVERVRPFQLDLIMFYKKNKKKNQNSRFSLDVSLKLINKHQPNDYAQVINEFYQRTNCSKEFEYNF